MKPFREFCALLRDQRAATSVVFALSLIPVGISAGAAVDLAQANRISTKARAAMDAAVLSAVQLDSAQRNAYAQGVYAAQMRYNGGETGTPVFTTNANGSFTGTVTIVVPTTMMKLAGRATMDVGARATASRPVEDTSCILTLAGGLTVGANALTLNGGPALDLSGCTLRSNASMVCNGHDGEAINSIAVGTANGCNNPQPGSAPVPDIHAALASNIQKLCGISSLNITWNVGSTLANPQMYTAVNAQGITEYHVCGNVTLKGSGTLLGSSGSDSILVIENGSLTLDKHADITLTRTTLVLTGTAGTNHYIDFPQGNGQAAALRLTPSQAPDNPWRGVGVYQDPSLTANVNMSWGPGANFYVDGLIYFPNASFTMSGNGNSNSANCTKVVTRDFTSNGAVNWVQTPAGCSTIGIKQYFEAPRLLS